MLSHKVKVDSMAAFSDFAVPKLLKSQLPKGYVGTVKLFFPQISLHGRCNRRQIRVIVRSSSGLIHGRELNAVVSRDLCTSMDPEFVESTVIHFFRVPLIQDSAITELLKLAQTKVSLDIVGPKIEQCFNIGLGGELKSEKLVVLRWLLGERYEPENLRTESFLDGEEMEGCNSLIVEVGLRLSYTTTWSTNAVSICRSCGLSEVVRMERSRRYLLFIKDGADGVHDQLVGEFAAMVHGRMTERVYRQKLSSFETSVFPEEVRFIPVMEMGRKALEEINEKMCLTFDEQDLQYYTRLFKDDIKRNPTTVELFDIAQSNSEHSRNWFFTRKIVIDGEPMDQTLMQIFESTLKENLKNSVIGFKDNSSAIKGFTVKQLHLVMYGATCPLYIDKCDLDILFPTQTHNFPCVVAPYLRAETGAGGQIKGYL